MKLTEWTPYKFDGDFQITKYEKLMDKKRIQEVFNNTLTFVQAMINRLYFNNEGTDSI